MNKIFLIIKREYLTRVRKKSFIIMTIIGPILMAALMIVPVLISQINDDEFKNIAVIDSSKLFNNKIPETNLLKFEYLENTSLEQVQKTFKESDYYAVLYIPHIISYSPSSLQLFSNKQPNLSLKLHISNAIEKELEKQKLYASGIDENILQAVKTNVSIKTFKWTDEGLEEETSTELKMAVGFILGFLIYIFIFLYGNMVMRGVIEEKTNRIVEIIVSSVKPFQLMLGKIIGVALVGLTQFLLWVILTFSIVTISQKMFFSINTAKINIEQADNYFADSSSYIKNNEEFSPEKMDEIKDMFSTVSNINFPLILTMFVFYFIGGYLLYSSLFAAIGSAVDNEADTQQFIFPLTIPLILAIVIAQNVIQNHEGAVSFWFSIIPFTSPIVMLVRIPFGVPVWEVLLSMSLLIGTFILTTWMAGKIYRTGILMYGKKTNYKELWKWLKYKN